MPLADFTINLHDEEHPERRVRVVVHKSLRALRSAVTNYDRRAFPGKTETASEIGLLGVCHRFLNEDANGVQDPLVAIVRLAPPHMGAGIMVHELCHAVTWIREIEQEFKPEPLTCENDERFCWLVGELMAKTNDTLWKNGVYDHQPDPE